MLGGRGPRDRGWTGNRREREIIMRVVLTSVVALVAVGGAAGSAAAWTTERVSVGANGKQANGDSFVPSVSADGRRVAFVSFATNLVPGDTSGQAEFFVRDLQAGTTKRVSVGAKGAQANSESSFPSISAGGQFVGFASPATNLVPGDTTGAEDVFVRDLQAGTTKRVSIGANGKQTSGGSNAASISGNGRLVAFQSAATDLVP